MRPVIKQVPNTGVPPFRLIVICKSDSSTTVPSAVTPTLVALDERGVPVAVAPMILPLPIENIVLPEKIEPDKSVELINEEKDPLVTPEADKFPDDLRITCPVCDKVFKHENLVVNHVHRSHKRSFRCRSCKAKYFTRSDLEEHKKTHDNDSFHECTICHMQYKRKEGLKQHLVRVHSTTDAKFMCDHCGNRYKLKFDLLIHVGRVHMSGAQICRFCGKAVKDVKKHEWHHQNRDRNIVFNFSCQTCGQKFQKKNKYDNHMLIHKEGYTCQECGIKVSSRRQLSYHMSLKHKPGMTCTVCKKVFTSSSNFYQHVLTHAGIRPYKCDICREDFTQRSSLLRHRKTHPGTLPPLAAQIPIADIARNYLERI